MPDAQLLLGDCLLRMAEIPDSSVDAIVTDPPCELGFMGKRWDASGIAFRVETWAECLRVLKPGGHLLAFGGSRTYHRMAVAIEDARFEIRDSIMWLYGSGMPKGKAQLKPAHEPIVVARKPCEGSERANVKKWGTGGMQVDACRVGTESTKRIKVTVQSVIGIDFAGPFVPTFTPATLGCIFSCDESPSRQARP